MEGSQLTHWGQVTHTCISKLTILGSDNGLSPGWRQAIIWTNTGILLIKPFGTNFSEILIEIHTFSFKKMHLKLLSAKWRPFCLGLNVLSRAYQVGFSYLHNVISYIDNTASLFWNIHLLSACKFDKLDLYFEICFQWSCIRQRIVHL